MPRENGADHGVVRTGTLLLVAGCIIFAPLRPKRPARTGQALGEVAQLVRASDS